MEDHFGGLTIDQLEYDIVNVGNLFPYEFNISYFQSQNFEENLELFKSGGQFGYLKFDGLKAHDKMVFFEDSIVKAQKVLKIPECSFFKYNDQLDLPRPENLQKVENSVKYCPMAFQWLDESSLQNKLDTEHESVISSGSDSMQIQNNLKYYETKIIVPKTDIQIFMTKEFLENPNVSSSIQLSNKIFFEKLPELFEILNGGEDVPITSKHIKELFHRYKINQRHLGKVANGSKIPGIRKILLEEMIARSAKKLYYSLFIKKNLFISSNIEKIKHYETIGTKLFSTLSKSNENNSDQLPSETPNDKENPDSKTKSENNVSTKKPSVVLDDTTTKNEDDLSKMDDDSKTKSSVQNQSKTKKTEVIIFLEKFLDQLFGDIEKKAVYDFWHNNLKKQIYYDFAYILSDKDISEVRKNSLLVLFCENTGIDADIKLVESEKASCGIFAEVTEKLNGNCLYKKIWKL